MIPVGDSPRSHTTPFVNYAFILINIVAFVYTLMQPNSIEGSNAQANAEFRAQTEGVCYGHQAPPTDADRFVCERAFQPAEWLDAAQGDYEPEEGRMEVLFTIVTAMFLHGGWLHIIGNLLFLWVFGDNVEDRLGHLGYLLFYMFAGIMATLVQTATDPDSLIPVLGASGAVAGVLGAYILYYPRATVNVVIPFFILIFIPIPIPAFIMIGIWFLQNLVSGYATIASAAEPGGGTAWFAHIGGFIVGLLVAALFRGRKPRPAPRWER